MRLEDRYDVGNLRNRSRDEVFRRIEELLAQGDKMCGCESCVLDLAAFTLNRVTPRYTTSILGDLHPAKVLERKIQTEIHLALKAGLRQLRRHPHH